MLGSKVTERKELDFEKKRQELISFLTSRENKHMVLATSHDNRVQARVILVASEMLDIYFFTWKHSRKIRQIQENPRVALCKDAVQIEGTAEILGNLTDEKIGKFVNIMRSMYPDAIEKWERQPGMVLVRIRPVMAVTGGSSNGDTYIDYLDLEHNRAYSEKWAHF